MPQSSLATSLVAGESPGRRLPSEPGCPPLPVVRTRRQQVPELTGGRRYPPARWSVMDMKIKSISPRRVE